VRSFISSRYRTSSERRRREPAEAAAGKQRVSSLGTMAASAPSPLGEEEMDDAAPLRLLDGGFDLSLLSDFWQDEHTLLGPEQPGGQQDEELSLATLWLKMPAVGPLDVQWGRFGAAASAAAGLGAGLGVAQPPVAMEGHIQPGCTLLSVDALVVAGGMACNNLSASAALQSLLAGDSPFAAWLRRQPELTLGLELRGVTSAARITAGGAAVAVPGGAAQLSSAHLAPLALPLGARARVALRAPLPQPLRAAARMHGQTLPLHPVEGGWELPAVQQEGLAVFTFSLPAPLPARAPALATAALLLVDDASVAAEVNRAAEAAGAGAAAQRVAAAAAALGHALRFDPGRSGAPLCSAELAARAAAACFEMGWRAGAARLLPRLAAAEGRIGFSLTHGSLLHAAAASAGADWAVAAVLQVAVPGGADLGGPCAAGLGLQLGATPLHLAAARGAVHALRALTRSPAGVAAFYCAQDGRGGTPSAALAAAARAQPAIAAAAAALDAEVRPTAAAAAGLALAALAILRGELGLFESSELAALGPGLLASAPEFARLRARAGEETLAIAAAMLPLRAAAEAAAERKAEAQARRARAAEADEIRQYESERALANRPSTLAWLAILFAYEWKANATRARFSLRQPSPEKIAAMAGRVISRVECLALIHSESNWSAFHNTVALTLLLCATYVSPRARAWFARHHLLLLALHWTILYIVNPFRMQLEVKSLTQGVSFTHPPWWSAVTLAYTYFSAASAMSQAPLAALVALRGVAIAILGPLGCYPIGGGLLFGRTSIAESCAVSLVSSLLLAWHILRLDAANKAAWRAARARRLKAKVE